MVAFTATVTVTVTVIVFDTDRRVRTIEMFLFTKKVSMSVIKVRRFVLMLSVPFVRGWNAY